MNKSKTQHRPIKVLFVQRPSTGGIRQHVCDLIKYLDREQVEPFLVCPPEEPDLVPQEIGETPLYQINIDKEVNPIRDFRTSQALKQLIYSTGVDIIHAHGYKASLISWWANQGIPNHPPLICTFHNPLIKQTGFIKNYLSHSIRSAIGRHAIRVVVVSKALQTEATNLLKIPAKKVICILNGLNISRIEDNLNTGSFRREIKAGPNDPLIGCVARLIPEKGIQYLIPVASRLRDCFPRLRMVIVGDGPFRSELIAEIDRRGLAEQFIFTGFRSDIPKILSAIDVFILPSLYEALSIAVMEAMAAKKPVIASNIGGIPEIITPGTGILVEPGNSLQITAALHDLLSNPLKRSRLGVAGFERVRSKFSIDGMILKYHNLYREITTAKDPVT